MHAVYVPTHIDSCTVVESPPLTAIAESLSGSTSPSPPGPELWKEPLNNAFFSSLEALAITQLRDYVQKTNG